MLVQTTVIIRVTILALLLAGCAAPTRVTPPRTDLHRRDQAPGKTVEWKLRIGAEAPARATPDGATRPADATPVIRPAAWTRPAPEGDDTPDGGIAGVLRAAVERGTPVELTVTTTVPPAASEQTLSATGPGLSTTAAGTLGFETFLPSLAFERGASAGASGLTAVLARRGVNALHVMGGLCLIAAIVPVVVRPRRLGLAAAVAGAGVLLIAAGTVAERYPWILALALLAFMGALAWLALDAWRARRNRQQLFDVVHSIDAAKGADPVLAERLDANRRVIRAAQGTTARAVDTIRKRD